MFLPMIRTFFAILRFFLLRFINFSLDWFLIEKKWNRVFLGYDNPENIRFYLFIFCFYMLFERFVVVFERFSEKEWLKKQKIADLSLCFEFQVVVAVVGFKWRSWGNAKIADLRSGNAFNSLPQKNALMSFFNGVGSCFSILHRLWICHAALIV